MEYTKGKALVIGVNEYTDVKPLSKAVNDASSFASALENLCFYVKKALNPDIDECDNLITSFIDSLKDFDSAVFYFAGHGVEINGHNYLLVKNTPGDSDAGVKRYSIDLQDVVEQIHNTGIDTSIIIIDACRNNPFKDRGVGSMNLAPMFAPKGTLIAYSTSPGQTASDDGFGENSIYTGAILQHINEQGLSVEDFFKKVRTTVYTLSKEKQTSWEHTSLIGRYSFNSGQLIHSLNVEYSPLVVADKSYDLSDPLIGGILNLFKSYNYYQQSIGLLDFKQIPLNKLDKNQLFIIGRNILQSAVGNCWDCQKFISTLADITAYNTGNENHLFNGILFEMYFNSSGSLRKGGFKGQQYLSQVMQYRTNPQLQNSFTFIKNALLPLSDKLLFIPSDNPQVVSLNATIIRKQEMIFDKEADRQFLDSLKFDVTELLQEPDKDIDFYSFPSSFESIEELSQKLCSYYQIPDGMLKVIAKEEITDRLYMKKRLRQL